MPKDCEVQKKIAEFVTWIAIYGSDGAVDGFHRFMQAIYNDAPGSITLRLYGDFILEVRRDLTYPDTTATRHQILGMRITDVYGTRLG